MKSDHRFIHLLSHLRIFIAGTLISAAAALGFTAVKMSNPTSLADLGRPVQAADKFKQDPDELFGNKVTRPGISRDKGPAAAASEKLHLRAYPADDVPSEATLNAIASFKHMQASGAAVNAPSAPAQWHLIGPSKAVAPAILTFSGAQYITSGRITALAIAPTCTTTRCRVYVAAAGGG